MPKTLDAPTTAVNEMLVSLSSDKAESEAQTNGLKTLNKLD